ncbi:bifunctional adenosylcobinamide kinase/adenosylcobinamide-phosphate guanylyltransferase [Hahella aquimaris]|uniref:bifunctional adenosylcobinamide kinase/adenosylcobinamide-phosphate guanylyltransferase n=1 Tax=Hahella sp. HNIBRBA332 TaxID=3015983 RepID=UPI00273A7867|nr:bifunctional adenosylcobinamide kinase/adenosylcobinamide-phosphate guanylyltransferase [Hahella sp. HNIBRBA332]WLQ12287.1 bifunctional adenosylcobinamide kinase/adenosylcobinamide-phosphate guanylyltransferase [Hahella sp. HNIBRBA332]
MRTLILGGVKSGKSALAERLASAQGNSVVYIATATAGDGEMAARIAHHRARRPAAWGLIEAPVYLADAICDAMQEGSVVLVDCLTLWLTNLLISNSNELFDQQRRALLDMLPHLDGDIIFVSNETNMGVTPLGELSRRYCDEAGLLHQALAALCDRVVLTVAGLPHCLKGRLELA